MTEVIAAIVGAILAGSVQFFVSRLDLKKRKDALVSAIAAEVGTCCEFIRAQRYQDQYSACAEAALTGTVGKLPPIDAKQNYFVIFESISPEIGMVGTENVAIIVRFYTLLKIGIDTSRPESLFEGNYQNASFMHCLCIEILKLGEEIERMPEKPIKLNRLA